MFPNQAPPPGSGGITEAERGTLERGLVPPDAPALPVEQMEFFPEAHPAWVRVILKGGETHGLTWTPPIPDAASLPGGSARCRIQPGRWDVFGPGGTSFVFTFFNRLPPPLERAAAVTKNDVPRQVLRAARPAALGSTSPRPSGAAPAKTLFAVQPDPTALERSPELRSFTWQLLEHFFGAMAARGREVSSKEIELFAAARPEVKAALERVTQAWGEMRRTTNPTVQNFKPLAELIVEQYQFGNETIVYNELALREGPTGLGLYHRANGLKYYDDHGIPALDIMDANRRDVYYAPRQRQPFRFAPARRDWATLKLLQLVGVVDLEAVAVAEGLWANLDLWVRNIDTTDWDKVLAKMRVQAGMIALFFGAECCIVLLEKFGSAREKAAAALLHAGLVLTGRFFQIRFVVDLKQVMFEIGHQLYRVKPGKPGDLDPLSREHLNRASALARPLLDEIIALGLAAGAFKIASAAAPLLDPPGGPGGMIFVPAPVGAGGRMPPPAAGAAGSASVPTPDVLVVIGSSNRPSSTDEAKKPETGKELEKKLFAGDDRPDTPFYMSRRDRTLRTILQDLLKHLTNPKNQQHYKPDGKPPISVDPEKVNIETGKFLQQPQNRSLLERYWELYRKVQRELSRSPDYQRRKVLEEQDKALDDFIKGILGNKRPDKVEFFIDRRNFATSDASFVWWEEFHNLKHAVYIAAIQCATGLGGAGLELESVGRSRLIEPEPPP